MGTWRSPLHRDPPRGRAAVAEGGTSARRSSLTVLAPDGCDPATLWHRSTAELAAGLGALQDLTGQNATTTHFAMGLQLVVSQMKSAEPPFGTLGMSLAQPYVPVDALRPLLLQFVFPVLDNLHRGHQALEAAADQTPGLMALQTLLTKVRGHFARLLAGLGVSAIEPRGHRFDPREHEALAQTDDEGTEPGHISVVYQPGFRLGAQLLRPAQVGVARGSALTC